MSWITIFSSTPTASSRWSFPSQPFYSPVTKLARELHLAQLGVCASKIVDVEKLREKRIEKILSRIYIYMYICIYVYACTIVCTTAIIFLVNISKRIYTYTVYHD